VTKTKAIARPVQHNGGKTIKSAANTRNERKRERKREKWTEPRSEGDALVSVKYCTKYGACGNDAGPGADTNEITRANELFLFYFFFSWKQPAAEEMASPADDKWRRPIISLKCDASSVRHCAG